MSGRPANRPQSSSVQLEGMDIRPFAAGDAPALHAAVRESIVSLSRLFPWCSADYALADAEARVAACIAAWRDGSEYPFGIFACGGNEALLGCVGLNRIDHTERSANLGYWTGEAHRGRGIATRAAAWTAAFGFRVLGLARIEIVVLPDNAASQRVAGKLGAVREGLAPDRIVLDGRPVDAVLFSLSAGTPA
jgi:RimJ/RimL family protein N-acetyltransferase